MASHNYNKRNRTSGENDIEEEETIETLGKKIKKISSDFRQLAQSTGFNLQLLLSIKEDVVEQHNIGQSVVSKKVPLDACFSKKLGYLHITRAHVYTRVIIFEPYPSETMLYETFFEMRGSQEKEKVKKWWNDNRKQIMKYK
jgi:hypothetical protein